MKEEKDMQDKGFLRKKGYIVSGEGWTGRIEGRKQVKAFREKELGESYYQVTSLLCV